MGTEETTGQTTAAEHRAATRENLLLGQNAEGARHEAAAAALEAFIVLNGDGITVGEYECLAHANAAARDLAEAARAGGDSTNFYSVADRHGDAVAGGEEHKAR